MVIDDEQTADLEESQVFQWASLKMMISRNGNLLLGRRLDRDDHNLFELPGGKPEVGEDWNESIVREAQEEIGLTVEKESELKPVLVRQNTKKNEILLVIRVEAPVGEPVASTKELDEIRFYTPSELNQMLAEGKIRPVLEDAIKMFLEEKV